MAGVTEGISLSEWALRLGRAAGGLSDWTPALRVCALIAKADMLDNFQGSHAPDGAPWPPLRRPRTNSRGADRPLLDTGILRASTTAAGPGHVEEVTGLSLALGTELDYAAPHQYGATISIPEKRRRPPEKPWAFTGAGGKTVFTYRVKAHAVVIPARPFVGLSDAGAARCGAALRKYAAGALSGGA
jgi:phage gpG-like protein